MRCFHSLILATALLLSSACTSAPAAENPKTPAAAPNAPTAEPTLDLATPEPSQSQCPPLGAKHEAPRPADFAGAAATLRSYLDDGASLEQIDAALQVWGMRITPADRRETLGGADYARILPGPDMQIIATLLDANTNDSGSHAGDIVVYACRNGHYEIVYRALDDPAFDGYVRDPQVLSVEDVTGDGIFELNFSTGECGAATCLGGITILSAHGGGALHNLAPNFAYVPYPIFDFVASKNKAMDLVVVEGMLGDAAAGPQRALTETWSYIGDVFTRTNETLEPPRYRILALQDGDAALRRDDARQADTMYRRVIDDPSLQSWDGNPSVANEAQILAAFARVRLIESAARRGDETGAQVSFESLQNAAPENSPGGMYVAVGRALYETWRDTKDIARACAAAADSARANPATTQILGVDAFGTANYDYQAEDMCTH